MKKDEELLRENYLAHKAKKQKQWDKKRKKAATKKRELDNIISCPDCNCIPCCCGNDNYCGGY